MEANLRTKLLSGVAAVALSSLVHAGEAQAQAGPYTWDFFLEGGYAVGDPGTNGLPYAEDRGTKSAFSIDPGDGWTGRLGLAKHFNGPWSGRLMYTGLAASKGGRTPDLRRPSFVGSAGVAAFPVATILPGGLPVNGFRGPGVGTSWNQAHVRTSVHADAIDLQAGYDVGLGGGVQGSVLAGLKYGEFNQSTNATFFAVSGFPEVFNFRKSSFRGVGPSLGGKVAVPVIGRLAVEGSVLGSLLFGHLDSKSPGTFVNPLSGPILTRNFHSDRMAETIEGQLALTYMIPLGPPTEFVDISAGYQMSYYAGVRDTRNGASGISSSGANDGAVFGSTSADLLFHGPFARLSWHW